MFYLLLLQPEEATVVYRFFLIYHRLFIVILVMMFSLSSWYFLFLALFRVNQSIFVQRNDPESRSKAAKAIRDRAEANGAWPQLVIFPEGLCATHTYLLPYKPGKNSHYVC